MKEKIEKIVSALQLVEPCENKRAVLLVFLTIVLLGIKIPEASNLFELPEKKVEAALCVCGVKLHKSQKFKKQLLAFTKHYNSKNNVLKLIA